MKTIFSAIVFILIFLPVDIFSKDVKSLRIVDVNKDIQIFLCSYEKDRVYYNSTIVRDGKRVLLIDSGSKTDGKLVAEKLSQMGLTPVKLIISHTHSDHIEGYTHFKGVEIYAGRNYKADLNIKLETVNKFKPHHLLREGDTIKFGKHTISILETPGHSPSGISCIINKRIVHSGDLIFFTKEHKLGVPYISGKIESYIQSLQKLRKIKPEMIIPGHGLNTKTTKDSLDKIDRLLYYLEKFRTGAEDIKLSACCKPGTPALILDDIHQMNLKKHKKKQ